MIAIFFSGFGMFPQRRPSQRPFGDKVNLRAGSGLRRLTLNSASGIDVVVLLKTSRRSRERARQFRAVPHSSRLRRAGGRRCCSARLRALRKRDRRLQDGASQLLENQRCDRRRSCRLEKLCSRQHNVGRRCPARGAAVLPGCAGLRSRRNKSGGLENPLFLKGRDKASTTARSPV